MDMLIEFAKIGIGVSCGKAVCKNELSNGSLIEINLPNAIPPRETGFYIIKIFSRLMIIF